METRTHHTAISRKVRFSPTYAAEARFVVDFSWNGGRDVGLFKKLEQSSVNEVAAKAMRAFRYKWIASPPRFEVVEHQNYRFLLEVQAVERNTQFSDLMTIHLGLTAIAGDRPATQQAT